MVYTQMLNMLASDARQDLVSKKENGWRKRRGPGITLGREKNAIMAFW